MKEYPMHEDFDPFVNNVIKPKYMIFNVGGSFMNNEVENNLITTKCKAQINENVFTRHHLPLRNLVTLLVVNNVELWE
jgi:hypothetical protein